MDSGKGKKKIIAKKTGRKSKEDNITLQQTYDADAELALALSAEVSSGTSGTSNAAGAAAAATIDDDFQHQQHLMLLQAQSEADSEYARQLAEEFAAETNHANDQASASAIREEPGDDMDSVLEEIAKMEAQERLKASGHAYNGKTNINSILTNEDEEEARIRENVKREAELREWREERARQDAEYAAMEEHDRLQELSKKAIETSIPEPAPAPAPAPVLQDEPELETIPLSKEDLRKARLAFFTANLPKS